MFKVFKGDPKFFQEGQGVVQLLISIETFGLSTCTAKQTI